MRLNLILIGPPGSGKGTQAVRIAEKFGIPHISTGDILRAAVRARTTLGLQVETTLSSGGLVGDDLMTDLVRERLAAPDAGQGFVLDGFPRTVTQAQALDTIVSVPLVIALIEAADEEIVRRLGLRRVCASCGLTQAVSADPELGPELGLDGQHDPCPYCGGMLVRREDDEPATVRSRLTTYARHAEPVIAYYRSRPTFGAVDGLRQPSEVTALLVTLIETRLPDEDVYAN
jgi:adenylate kinase